MTVKQPWNSSSSSSSTGVPSATTSASGGSQNNHNNPISNSDPEGGVKTTANKRPKSVSQWSVVDVQKWFRRNCGDYYHLYSEKLLEQDITGELRLYIHIALKTIFCVVDFRRFFDLNCMEEKNPLISLRN